MSPERYGNFGYGITVVLLLFLFSLDQVAGYSGLIPADEANPGKCIYRGDTLELGVNNGISPCQRLTCYEDGSILIEGCGKPRFVDCNRGERLNPGEPFPDCCKLRFKCKKPGAAPDYIDWDAATNARIDRN
ncbi:hypothetical protein KR026_012373 [Drosophila bipectinata]|nr:hypothetical protein KR026_012373 [Drosophila bipectinata]